MIKQLCATLNRRPIIRLISKADLLRMVTIFKLISFSFFCVPSLNSCSLFQRPFQPYNTVDTTNLAQLESIQVESRPKSVGSPYSPQLSPLRIQSLRESAMTIAAQGGLAWASNKMNKQMVKDDKYLDTIYNFHAMMLSHGVLPPVLEEGDYSLNTDDPNTIRVADRTYRIVKQARFATTAPNWREYIWFTYDKPVLPDRTLLPRSDREQQIWRCAVREGWVKGIEQAYTIFQQNLARLKRDYRGMVLYRKLLQERMISPPFVSRTELGVTGSGEDMRINDQVLRIVQLPKLQTNTRGWRAIVVKGHE